MHVISRPLRAIILSLLLAISFVATSGIPAMAQGLVERLVMPGEVVEGHAKYEAQCEKCHGSFAPAEQTGLCLECHKEIKADRDEGKRFHGRQPDAAKLECRHCHDEHKGRGADVVHLDRERFDHDVTAYPLKDSHRSASCEGCHKPKTPFHKATTVCAECHKKVDPHKGKLEKCETCHQSSNWRATRTFDHDKTKFKIEGAHKDVRCGTCHVGEIYKDLDRTCVSCHRIQDVHNTRYGAKCENCHDQAKWKNAKYDHDKTKFPLRNAHAKVKCDTCHPGHVYDDKLEIGCVSCHQQQDPHTGQLGAKCEQCHNDAEWKKIRFDHNLTRFPLVGAHAPVKCTACHLSFHYKDTPIACEGCHKDSRHQGRLGASAKCSTCHSPMGWARWEYDHAKQANFPLTGAHRKLICEACHAAANPPSLKLPNVCEKCHKDFHQGRLGVVPKCGSCHDTERWTKGRYDHAKQANYPLIGHHAKITCETCHKEKNPASLKLPTDCHACHRQDDAHKGAFGTNCGRCHTPEDWKKVSIRN